MTGEDGELSQGVFFNLVFVLFWLFTIYQGTVNQKPVEFSLRRQIGKGQE